MDFLICGQTPNSGQHWGNSGQHWGNSGQHWGNSRQHWNWTLWTPNDRHSNATTPHLLYKILSNVEHDH